LFLFRPKLTFCLRRWNQLTTTVPTSYSWCAIRYYFLLNYLTMQNYFHQLATKQFVWLIRFDFSLMKKSVQKLSPLIANNFLFLPWFGKMQKGSKHSNENLNLFQIVDKFVESGLMNRQYDRVKLHLTLMNSLFRKEENGIADNESRSRPDKSGPKPDHRETFDARPIFTKFGDRKFGRVQVAGIHLSQRRSSKRSPDSYYLPSVVVSLTSCD